MADITYVRLRETFLYLAIVLDAYSRRVIGWELGEDLSAELALEAFLRPYIVRPYILTKSPILLMLRSPIRQQKLLPADPIGRGILARLRT